MNFEDTKDAYRSTTSNSNNWTTNLRLHGKNRIVRPLHHLHLTDIHGKKSKKAKTKTKQSMQASKTRCADCDKLEYGHKFVKIGLQYKWLCNRCERRLVKIHYGIL